MDDRITRLAQDIREQPTVRPWKVTPRTRPHKIDYPERIPELDEKLGKVLEDLDALEELRSEYAAKEKAVKDSIKKEVEKYKGKQLETIKEIDEEAKKLEQVLGEGFGTKINKYKNIILQIKRELVEREKAPGSEERINLIWDIISKAVPEKLNILKGEYEESIKIMTQKSMEVEQELRWWSQPKTMTPKKSELVKEAMWMKKEAEFLDKVKGFFTSIWTEVKGFWNALKDVDAEFAKLEKVISTASKTASKDVSGYISKNQYGFFVDKEEMLSGNKIVSPGDTVTFKYEGKTYQGKVTSETAGTMDDVYKVEIASKKTARKEIVKITDVNEITFKNGDTRKVPMLDMFIKDYEIGDNIIVELDDNDNISNIKESSKKTATDEVILSMEDVTNIDNELEDSLPDECYNITTDILIKYFRNVMGASKKTASRQICRCDECGYEEETEGDCSDITCPKCGNRLSWDRTEASKKTAVKLECMECGHKFSKSNPTIDTKCPKCGSYDIDMDYEASKKLSYNQLKEAGTPNKYYNKADRLKDKIEQMEKIIEEKKALGEDTKKERKKIQTWNDEINAIRKKIEKFWDEKYDDIEVEKKSSNIYLSLKYARRKSYKELKD